MKYEDLIAGKPKEMILIMDKLREISQQIHPELEEDFYGGKAVQMALYSLGDKNNVIHGIAASKDHCKLFFHHFDKIDLSMFKMEGKGKHSRHVKIFSIADINESVLTKTIKSILKIAATKN